MLTREEIERVWADVKANQAALGACAGPHDFQPEGASKPLGRRFRCSICGGLIESTERVWYERGLAHGRPCIAP